MFATTAWPLQGAPAGQQQQLSPTRSTSRYSVPSARASLEDIAGPGAMPSVMRWESLGALENLLENEPMSSAAGGLKPLKSNSFSALTAAFRAAGINVVAGDGGDAQDLSKVRCMCTVKWVCLWYVRVVSCCKLKVTTAVKQQAACKQNVMLTEGSAA